jgi:hypothetical protein
MIRDIRTEQWPGRSATNNNCLRQKLHRARYCRLCGVTIESTFQYFYVAEQPPFCHLPQIATEDVAPKVFLLLRGKKEFSLGPARESRCLGEAGCYYPGPEQCRVEYLDQYRMACRRPKTG